MNNVAKVLSAVAVLALGLVLLYSANGALPVSAQVVTGDIADDFISNTTTLGAVNTTTITIRDAGRDGAVQDTMGQDIIEATFLSVKSGTETINVTSTERDPVGAAGVFTVVISVMATSGTTTPFEIAAADGDDIEVRYTGSGGTTRLIRTAPSNKRTVKVDGAGPSLDDFSPEDGSTSNDDGQTLSVEVEDTGAGLGDEDAIRGVEGALGNVFFTIGQNDLPADEATALNDEETKWRVTLDVFDVAGTLVWTVTAEDDLGNTAVSVNLTVIVDVDAPEVESAVTGHAPDADADPVVDEAADNRKSILIMFNEDIDGDSIIRGGDNFQVLDEDDRELAIDKAEHFDDIVIDGVTSSRAVYITLEKDLDAADEPKVLVVRAIKDGAGNELTSAEVDADDGIAPSVTVLVDGTAEDEDVTTRRISIRVTSDELSTDPSIDPDDDGIGVTVRKFVEGAADPTLVVARRDADDFDVEDGSRVWEWEFEFEDDEAGLYNVVVMVTDGDNVTTEGTAAVNDDGDVSGDAIVFEVDTGIPGVVLTPEETDNADAFIRLSFEGGVDPDGDAVLAEGNEYEQDSHDTVFVSSITITLENAIDGTPVEFSTINDTTFTVGPQDLPVGTHDITVVATDEAGNEAEFIVDIEITERVPFEFLLQPGWNLISLPGTPASTDINDVIPADHPINAVRTYDPTVPGGFLIAERDPSDGLFAGTLSSMDRDRGYFVRTTTFEELGVLIPRLSVGERITPPTVELFEGWNLVSIIDVGGDNAFGEPIDPGAYLGGLDVAKVYGLNRDTGALAAVDMADIAGLQVGQGYWVYLTGDGVLVP